LSGGTNRLLARERKKALMRSRSKVIGLGLVEICAVDKITGALAMHGKENATR